jgi:hypothetical protein
VFHVKHFGPIDTLRKRTFPRGSWYEAGIWGKRTFAIRFMLGCGCLPGQTIVATHRGADAKIFPRLAHKTHRCNILLIDANPICGFKIFILIDADKAREHLAGVMLRSGTRTRHGDGQFLLL